MDLGDAKAWCRAERDLARPLAQLTGYFARLDERLSPMHGLAAPASTSMEEPEPAMLGHLAGEEAVALAQSHGARVSLDAFLLWRHGAPLGRTDPAALATAGWAARRLSAPAARDRHLISGPDELRAFLGRGRVQGRGDGLSNPILDPFLDRSAGLLWDDAAVGFCAALAALGSLAPLVRAAAAAALWRTSGLGSALEGTVLAMRLAAASWEADSAGLGSDGRMSAGGQGYARFLPLGGVPTMRRSTGQGPVPHDAQLACLASFLDAGLARLPPALAGVSRRQSWLATAQRAAPAGRVARAALPVIALASLVSSNLLRDRLGVTQQAANQALTQLAARGLIEEVSGQRRYRFWRARL